MKIDDPKIKALAHKMVYDDIKPYLKLTNRLFEHTLKKIKSEIENDKARRYDFEKKTS